MLINLCHRVAAIVTFCCMMSIGAWAAEFGAVGEITNSSDVLQTFQTKDNNFNCVSFPIAGFARKNTCKLQADLIRLPENTPLASRTIPATELVENSIYEITFPPVTDSKLKKWALRLSSPDGAPGNALTTWMNHDETNSEDKLSVGGKPVKGRIFATVKYKEQQQVPFFLTVFIVMLPLILIGLGCAGTIKTLCAGDLGKDWPDQFDVFWCFLLTVLFFYFTLQLPVYTPSGGCDGAYPFFLNKATFMPGHFGVKLVYTYGPLSFLLFTEHVNRNVKLAYMFWPTAYGLLCLMISALIYSRCRGPRTVFAIGIALFALYFVDPERIIPVLAVLLAFLGFQFPNIRTRLLVIGGVMTAFGIYMKLTIGFSAGAALAGSAIFPYSLRASSRRVGSLALTTIASLFVFWFLMNGSFAGLYDYFRISYEIVKGYSSMGRPAAGEGYCILAFIAAIAVLFGFAAKLPSGERLHACAVITGPVFDSWKHALNRLDDGHIIHLFASLTFLAMFIYLIHERRSARLWPSIWRTATVAAVVLISNLGMWIVSDAKAPFWNIIPRSAQYGLHMMDGIDHLKNIFDWKAYNASLEAVGVQNLSAYNFSPNMVATINKGHVTTGNSVCVYSYDLGAFGYNPVTYKLTPIPQYFNAYTRALDQLHADFFSAPTRPDYVLLYNTIEMSSIDDRYILFDDNLAQLAILNNYRVARVERDGNYKPTALLSDTGSPRFAEPVAMGKVQAAWNEEITVPAIPSTSILRVRAHASISLFKKLKASLLHLSPMKIHYKTVDGQNIEYGLVSTHMGDGVWVEPMMPKRDVYFDFLNGNAFICPNVASIRFDAMHTSDYQPTIDLEWERTDALNPALEGNRLTTIHYTNEIKDGHAVNLNGSVETPFPANVPSCRAITLRLGMFCHDNSIPVVLELLDAEGKTLARSELDASEPFNGWRTWDHIFGVNIKPDQLARCVKLRVSCSPTPDCKMEIWTADKQDKELYFRIWDK